MALRFLDSFDHYTTLTQKWTASADDNSINAAAARTGAYGMRHTSAGGQSELVLNAQGTWIIGLALNRRAAQSAMVAQTRDAGTEQGSFWLENDGRLTLRRGGVVVATSVNALILNVFYYTEFKHIIDNVAGTLEVRVDGAVWATFNGDTQATANPTADTVRLGAGGGGGDGDWDADDLYILDGVDQSIADPNSPPNNDYLGDTQVQALVPVGAGAYTELATLVGAPTHWQAEDEVPPDEDVSYVEDAVVDRRDTFDMTNLAVVSATIPGIQILTRARKTAAGAANFARLYRNAAADNQGADTVLQESFAYHREILGGDPIAAGAWTVPNINSLEMGFRTR